MFLHFLDFFGELIWRVMKCGLIYLTNGFEVFFP
jgi:hypothetical protein